MESSDSYKLIPVVATLLKQAPISIYRVCSHPVDRPKPQKAVAFDQLCSRVVLPNKAAFNLPLNGNENLQNGAIASEENFKLQFQNTFKLDELTKAKKSNFIHPQNTNYNNNNIDCYMPDRNLYPNDSDEDEVAQMAAYNSMMDLMNAKNINDYNNFPFSNFNDVDFKNDNNINNRFPKSKMQLSLSNPNILSMMKSHNDAHDMSQKGVYVYNSANEFNIFNHNMQQHKNIPQLPHTENVMKNLQPMKLSQQFKQKRNHNSQQKTSHLLREDNTNDYINLAQHLNNNNNLQQFYDLQKSSEIDKTHNSNQPAHNNNAYFQNKNYNQNINNFDHNFNNTNQNGYEKDLASRKSFENNNANNTPNDTNMANNNNNSRVRYYPPRAFKFFMEQHVEGVIKYMIERQKRHQQLEKEMDELNLSEHDRNKMRKMLREKESQHLRLRRTKMDRRAFEKLAILGGGAFGSVFLVRKKDSGMLYAMKRMKKREVFNKKQIAHVKAERDILAEADNRWVVKLYFSFQDAGYLYLVMDFIQGGDLMGLLMKEGVFEAHLAQFYIAELVLAIESVHKLGFIHRDIKPDNILIDRTGHIKLTDFGLCTGFHWTHDSEYYKGDSKRMDEKKRQGEGMFERKVAKSLVGTPNYIAPEVLLQEGYTSTCDWWSVGVILYEMRFGQPPFRADSAHETQKKVINWRHTLRFPESNVSAETVDLISLLCREAKGRLGEASVIKEHPFFTNINFDDLHFTTAPFVPHLETSTDISYFDAAKPISASHHLPPTTLPRRSRKPSPRHKATKQGRRRSDSADSALQHNNNSSSNGSNHHNDDELYFYNDSRHDLIDFTFRRFFDNDSPDF